MTDTDWHDAQVIEATTPSGRAVLTPGHLPTVWLDRGGKRWHVYALSDVRIVVDRDGNVAPPPITDEMVYRSAKAIGDRYGHSPGYYQTDARVALTAALGGEQP